LGTPHVSFLPHVLFLPLPENHPIQHIMTLTEFTAIVQATPEPVVLLEGRRSIPDHDAALASHTAGMLVKRFPELRFRSGNAQGTDQAFSEGIAQLAPWRLQIVAPYAGHRKNARHAQALYDSPESLSSVQEEVLACKTAAASPKNKGLIDKRGKKGALAAKAAYLIRDTMKVTGHSALFPKPVCALFFVDLNDPFAGGTGHTIRVCQQEGVPFALQDSWMMWFPK
jgi:hypothetical protein